MLSTTRSGWSSCPARKGTRSRDRFVVWNLYRSESHPPRLEHLLDPAVPQPLSAQDSRHPVRRGQPVRPSTPETLNRLQRTGAKVFRNDEHGDVIVTIKEEKVNVAV